MPTLAPVRILLAEDNADDVTIAQRALVHSNVPSELHVARDGREAIDYLFDDANKLDLILLDVGLPHISGLEVLEKIHADERLAMIPVVMLTGSDREEDVIRSYGLGSNTYIQKPVEYQAFAIALQVVVEYWGVVATLPRR